MTEVHQYGSSYYVKYLQVRMNEAEWKGLAHTAVERGLSISELVRGVLVKAGIVGNPVRGAEPVTEEVKLHVNESVGRTGGATAPTGAKPVKELRWCGKCARQVHDWEMVGGLALCERCRSL